MEPTIYKPSIYKGAGIYKTGADGGGGGGDLPDEYERCNYIESDGTAYLYAQISHAQASLSKRIMSVRYAPKVINDNNRYFIFAVRNYGSGRYSGFGVQDTNLLFVVGGQIFADSNSEYLNYVEQEMVCTSGTGISSNYTTDKVLGNNVIESFDRVYLFRYPDGGTISAGKFFYGKYRNEAEGKDVIEFIPAKRIADGVYGVWENVGKNFYPAYTGTFTGG